MNLTEATAEIESLVRKMRNDLLNAIEEFECVTGMHVEGVDLERASAFGRKSDLFDVKFDVRLKT